jgi:hypothetical protein
MLVIVTLSILAMIIGWPMAGELEEHTDADGNNASTPPPERHQAAASYCPKCKAEYRKGFGECNTCIVALIMYDEGQLGL